MAWLQLFISDHFACLTLFLLAFLLAWGNEDNYERFAAGERCMNLVVLVLLFVAAYMRLFQQVGAFRQSLLGRGLNFRRTALRTFARKSAAERNAASKPSTISELSNKSFKATADNNRGENNAANRAEAESDLQNFMQQAFAEAELGISCSVLYLHHIIIFIFLISCNVVTVTNSQKAIPIDTDEVTRQAKLLLEILNVRDFEVLIHYYLLFSSKDIKPISCMFVFYHSWTFCFARKLRFGHWIKNGARKAKVPTCCLSPHIM